jgi:hypothetical protein
MKMFLDQAFYIKNAIGSAMNLYENKEYTIVGHSIGCLIAMLIQPELINIDNLKLKNLICLGSPVLSSPTDGLNNYLHQI